MRLVKPMADYFFLCLAFFFISFTSYSQENSPFSRYGLGDVYPQQSVASRGMGGLSAAYTNPQAINTFNPASYGYIGIVTYDLGLSIDTRRLISATPANRFRSTNFIPSYIQLGVPLNKKGLGLVFGLKPATRINYSIEQGSRIKYDSLGITDSLHTIFEGDGGLNQVYFGLGKTWRSKDTSRPHNSFSIGFNAGYEWGTKFVSTKIDFPADSAYENWYRSNSTDSTHFWGLFLNPGVMASFTLNKRTDPVTKLRSAHVLVLGASGTLEQDLNATRDITRETFTYQDDGSIISIDSVKKVPGVHGKINIPLTFNAGFMINKMISNGAFEIKKWGFGADYSSTQWKKYLDYGFPDRLNNSWVVRIGGEFSPDPLSNKSMFKTGMYRVGYYRGKDYIDADGNGYKVQAFTLGYSFNLRKFRSYDRQFTMINTAVEIGKRGSDVNNVTENFFKFSLGLSLSDIWFIKRKYD